MCVCVCVSIGFLDKHKVTHVATMSYAAPAENSNTLELLKFYQCCFHSQPKHTHSQTHTPYTNQQDMKYSRHGFLGHISMMYK